MRQRLYWAVLACAAAALLGGCPETDMGQSGGGGAVVDVSAAQVSATAPANAKAGDLIGLSAEIDGADGANVTYRWYQVYGYAVVLSSATGPSVTFTAPTTQQQQTLRFRVDVEINGSLKSAETQVVIEEQSSTEPDISGDDPADDDPTPFVRVETSMGDILVELDREKAPISVRNFLRYVDDGFYEETLFHRVVADFVIQGGGFGEDIIQKSTRGSIKNESDNGLKNDRGTIAMARLSEPDSATSQFYFNLKDNDDLDAAEGAATGYAVFGKIAKGLDVMDAIGAVEVETRSGLQEIPVENILIERIVRVPDADAEAEIGAGAGAGSGGGATGGVPPRPDGPSTIGGG